MSWRMPDSASRKEICVAQHIKINPDPYSVVVETANEALSTARGLQTRRGGNAYFSDGSESGVLVGPAASHGIDRWNPDTGEQEALWAADMAEQRELIDKNTNGVEVGKQLAQEAQEKAESNAAAIEQAGREFDEYRGQVDAAQAALDKTLSEQGSVVSTVRSDQAALRNELLAPGGRMELVEQLAANAQTTADSKNTVYIQSTDPHDEADKAALIVPGDLWWQTSAKAPETYWTGEANNSVSVLVDHSDEIIHMWVWNGDGWNSHIMYAQDLLVNGSISTSLLAADSITADKIKAGAITADKIKAGSVTANSLAANALYSKVIKGGQFLSGNEKLILNDAGLVLKDKDNRETITFNAGDGSATMHEVLIIDGSLTAPTVEGGVFRGGEYVLVATDGRTIGKLNPDGVWFGDSLVYSKVNDEWQLKLTGALHVGGEIQGTTFLSGTDANNRTEITQDTFKIISDGHTLIEFTTAGGVDLGSSGIASDSRVSDLTDEVHDSYTPLATFEQTTEALGESVTNVQTQVDATVDRLDEEIDARKQYMQFDPDTGLTIGDLTNTDAYSVQLTSTAMQFRAGNTVAAYVSNDRLYINKAEIVNTLRIGNFAFLPRDNGHMSLQYVGGNATVQEA